VAAVAVIPFGGSIDLWGHTVELVGSDLNIGVLFLFALSGLGFYGLILGGWSWSRTRSRWACRWWAWC
jgi:NADH-quinone oxidoreductase subunit H